jgi:hypothetical protein
MTLVGLPRIQPPVAPADELPFELTRLKSYVRAKTSVLHRPQMPARADLAGFGPAHMVAAVLVCASVMFALRVML